jgi:hypothetical protein
LNDYNKIILKKKNSEKIIFEIDHLFLPIMDIKNPSLKAIYDDIDISFENKKNYILSNIYKYDFSSIDKLKAIKKRLEKTLL